MSKLRIPEHISGNVDAHKRWLELLDQAQYAVDEDVGLQRKAAAGLRIKGRSIAPEVIGRSYAQYCNLINQLYDAYLQSVQLQRAPYILEIINAIVKRMFELRKELEHIIVNDYIYVDTALEQLKMIPLDIQIVVPYHFPLESRSENIEQVLQQMWADAVKKKKIRDRALAKQQAREAQLAQQFPDTRPYVDFAQCLAAAEEEYVETPPPSVHTLIPEQFIQAILIQRHERFRQWYMRDFRQKCSVRRTYYAAKIEVPEELKDKASRIVQLVCREFMKTKRERIKEHKRDILLGLVPDPFRATLNLKEENDKVYERRRSCRIKIKEKYLQELDKENTRLLIFKKWGQIDDITDEIRSWFREWFYGYGFFPQYPYEVEGGTMVVVRGDYPTIEEQFEEDAKNAAMRKGKTADQIKEEKAQAKENAKLKAEALKAAKDKEELALQKQRMNPETDPGYKPKESQELDKLVQALQYYKASWSIYDDLPPDRFKEAIYGFMMPLLTEELMQIIHKDCRKYIDEWLRLDLKLLVKMHQKAFKELGWEYPKFPRRKKPKPEPVPKVFYVDDKLKNSVQIIFDLGIITKPTTKFTEIYGDSKYGAYDCHVKDPDVSYPIPGYGDIKTRLMLSCVLGCGIQPGAPRIRAVMLLGPERNGKSFLIDAVVGELNAVKIDISPECFSSVLEFPNKVLPQVFLAAKAFQPAVIYIRNIERVFAKKVPPELKYLKAGVIKASLIKSIKGIQKEDKIIFIATCSYPFSAIAKPMCKLFDEVILVPRTDYGSIQQFLQEKILRESSIPRDFPTQPLAHLLQGYGFGVIVEAWNDVVTPERRVSMNAEPLTPGEIFDVILEKGIEPITLQDYQAYTDFYLKFSPFYKERQEYDKINYARSEYYKKQQKIMEKMKREPSKISNMSSSLIQLS